MRAVTGAVSIKCWRDDQKAPFDVGVSELTDIERFGTGE